MKEKLLAAILFCCVVGVQSEFKFGEMTTVPTEGNLFYGQKRISSNWIYVIEKDLRNEGNVLVGTVNAIFSLSLDNDTSADQLIAGGVTGYAEGVGGNARFSGITGIVQQEKSILVVDRSNHCLRKLEIVTNLEEEMWETSPFAGMCGSIGDVDGRRLNARFSSPWSVVKDSNVLYIADSENYQIKQLDLVTNLVTSVYQTGGLPPYGLVLGKNENEFYVTVYHGVVHIKDQTETWLVGSETAKTTGTQGKFTMIGFYYPRQIRWLADSTLVVADSEVDTVKVIDLHLKEVKAICKGPGDLDGSIYNCLLDTPQSILVDEGKIYVGCRPAAGALKQIEYSIVDSDGGLKLNCEAPPQKANAEYSSLDKYPIGTEIEYTCTNRYVNRGSNNTRSVCVNGGDRGAVWSDADVKCQLSAEIVAVTVLAVLLFVVSLLLVLLALYTCRQRGEQRQEGKDENYTEPVARPNNAYHDYNPPPPRRVEPPVCEEDEVYDEAQ